MDEIRFDPQTGRPVQPQYAVMRKTFSATAKERLLALLSYPAAFLYVCAILAEGKTLLDLYADNRSMRTMDCFIQPLLKLCIGCIEYLYHEGSEIM